jgi:hypothetical protein
MTECIRQLEDTLAISHSKTSEEQDELLRRELLMIKGYTVDGPSEGDGKENHPDVIDAFGTDGKPSNGCVLTFSPVRESRCMKQQSKGPEISGKRKEKSALRIKAVTIITETVLMKSKCQTIETTIRIFLNVRAGQTSESFLLCLIKV